MNQWWLLAFLGMLGGTFFLGDRYGANEAKIACDKIESAQKDNTIGAQAHIISQVETQGQVTQNAETKYAKDSAAIISIYDPSSVQPFGSASGHMRPVSTPACGTQTSKVYKLTPQQCDQEEAKCNALWNWANQQAVIK